MAKVIGVIEAANKLDKTPAALRNGYKRWEVPHFYIGGQVKFTEEALDDWITKNMNNGGKRKAPRKATQEKAE